MGSPLKTLANTALAEVNVAQQSTIISNQTPDAIQILALMNAAGLELCAKFDWQAIQKEYRFTTQYLVTTGVATSGSPIITGIPSTSGLDSTYMVASGTGVPQDTYIVSVNSGSQVTVSQNMTATGTLNLTFGKTQYSMPADFDRMIERTTWDKTKHWESIGPETPQEWQWLKSGYISTGPRIRWRRMGNYFQTWPVIASPEYMGFEYVSNSWVTTAGSTVPTQSSFQADTDSCVFDDRLIIMATKLKYFEVKGWDTTAFKRDYDEYLGIRMATDKGMPTLSMAPRMATVLVGWPNIPDSGYGS